jgi:hypothetical protein
MVVSPFWFFEQCSGRFAHPRHFKHRAGTDSDSIKHRFCAGAENWSRRNFPCGEIARQELPQQGIFCRVQSANTSTFHKRARAKPAQTLDKT